MEKDIFGFADAIQIDHLSDEQLKELENILNKIKQKAGPGECPICPFCSVV